MQILKPILLFLTFNFLTFLTVAKIPTSPYAFRPSVISELIPFSAKQLAVFKSKGVKRMEVEHILPAMDKKKIGYTAYHFNREGQLIQEVRGFRTAKKDQQKETITYRYNQHGIIARMQEDEMCILKDTLTYDGQGKLIRWKTTSVFWKGKKKETTETFKDLSLMHRQGDTLVLKDREYNSVEYWYENQWIKTVREHRTDSLSTAYTKNGRMETYWYQRAGIGGLKGDTLPQLGMRRYIGPAGLLSEVVFDEYHTTKQYEQKHQYDRSGNPVQTSSAYNHTFFTYRNGLLDKVISVHNNPASTTYVSRYRYFYQ